MSMNKAISEARHPLAAKQQKEFLRQRAKGERKEFGQKVVEDYRRTAECQTAGTHAVYKCVQDGRRRVFFPSHLYRQGTRCGKAWGEPEAPLPGSRVRQIRRRVLKTLSQP